MSKPRPKELNLRSPEAVRLRLEQGVNPKVQDQANMGPGEFIRNTSVPRVLRQR